MSAHDGLPSTWQIQPVAEPEFSCLAGPLVLAEEGSPETIAEPLSPDFRWPMLNAELGLVMAAVNPYLGRPEAARGWARAGLEWANERSPFAWRLRAILEDSIAAGPSGHH